MTEFKLNPIENKGKRVLTTAQLAEAYGTTAKTITDNFNNNKNRYIEGKHYYCLTGDELKQFKNYTENFGIVNKRTPCLYLWTERGSLLHAKSINTDRAWEVHDFLVDNYFRVSEITSSHNEVLLQLVENRKVLERKIDALEKKVAAIDKKSEDIVDAIIVPGFKELYSKIESTSEKFNRSIIRSVTENVKLLGTYIDILIKKIK